MVGNVLRAIPVQERVEFYGGGQKACSVRVCVLNGDHALRKVSGARQVSGWWLPDKFLMLGLGGHRIIVQVEYQREALLSVAGDVSLRGLQRRMRPFQNAKPRYTVALVDDDGRVVHAQPFARMQPRIVAVRVEPEGVEEVRLPLSEVLRACLRAAAFVGDLHRDGAGVSLTLTSHDEGEAVSVPRRRRTWSAAEYAEVLRMKADFPHGVYQQEVARRFGITERNARRVISEAKRTAKKSTRKRGSK
jgi:hypothetical protein